MSTPLPAAYPEPLWEQAKSLLLARIAAGEEAVDILFDGTEFTIFATPRIATAHTHGTGCTFAAAIAARLAHGDVLIDAVGAAKTYVTRAIANAPGLGHGHGPLGPGDAGQPHA